MPSALTLTIDQARRLAVGAQCLAGPGPVSMEQVLRRLRCLQLDPIDVVARSHLLVLWSPAPSAATATTSCPSCTGNA
ncbi:hypothetical protein AB0D67_23850 [Streptosporangium sp. NPDC048047]|uniref:hypothetical protein n=1 Tax=Streptosporangium sp. NPDC048047 TaxID=3155748 RepID=UPI00343EBF18